MLCNYGFAHIFENVSCINSKVFLSEFKVRVNDVFKQEVNAKFDTSTVLSVYRYFKTSLEYELYLDILPKTLRYYFCRLR